MSKNLETAIFAAGCFWGVEEVFRTTKGVIETEVGYIGGALKNPTYQKVCTDTTGHAEAVRIQFDPNIVSYEELLQLFWKLHNPTTLNRQGPDVGSQYRSGVFYTSEEQKKSAEKIKQEVSKTGKWKNPIVTEIVPAADFYRADEYHQKYVQKHGGGSCHL